MGDELVARVGAGAGSEKDRTTDTMRLLSLLYAGYPIERILPLLRSAHEPAVKFGVFLAAEMTSRAGPLLGEIENLLFCPASWVRHDAITVVLTAASESDGRLVAKAIGLIDDDDPIIREDAMCLLAGLGDGVLRASLSDLDPADKQLTTWLVDATADQLRCDIPGMLRDPDRRRRCFAGAAIVRYPTYDLWSFRDAVRSTDTEIVSFLARRKSKRA